MKLLDPLSRGGLALRNRIVVAAMSRMQGGEDGTASLQAADYYARFARGGAGLVITEALYTDGTSARAYFRQPGLAEDRHVDGWRPVTRAVHEEGSLAFAQLQHGGRLAEPGLNPLHLAASEGTAAGVTWQTGRPNAPARAATAEQLDAIVDGFVAAAARAVDAGFDGIELHGARGYLLDDFLSASTNRREDAYGGSLQARLALPLRVLRAVRAVIGARPLSYNASLYKMDDGGYQPPGGAAEVEAIARALHGAGADLLHVTTRRLLRDEPWGEPLVVTVRRAVPDAVVIGNGGVKSTGDAEEALGRTDCDLVSIARAFLANPDWLARQQRGEALRAYAPGMEREPLIA
ncbi:MAG TPA: NADH:flavin oxidoreductase [Ramlibacter sp.]|nr:NADH:flavin oxidoreductase [Ramlibacter sp.]